MALRGDTDAIGPSPSTPASYHFTCCSDLTCHCGDSVSGVGFVTDPGGNRLCHGLHIIDVDRMMTVGLQRRLYVCFGAYESTHRIEGSFSVSALKYTVTWHFASVS